MDVKLLELPEGEDPDSFVRQFGKDSFLEMKNEQSEDFLSYLIHKAQGEGKLDDPAQKKRVISEALESIAHMPDQVSRETYVQHLNSLVKVGDRALFDELGKILQELQEQKKRAKRREQRQAEREARQQQQQRPPDHHTQGFEEHVQNRPQRREPEPPQKRPNYEKELIRLMLLYGRDMIDYIGSFCNEQQFEDKELRSFFEDIIDQKRGACFCGGLCRP